MTGAAMALPVNANTAASSVEPPRMSVPQILILKRFEVIERFRAGFMVEIMPHPVAERAAIDECCLQPEMQAYLRCKIDRSLADFWLIRFRRASEGLSRHHADPAETCHKCLVRVAPLLRSILSECRNNRNGGQQASP